MTDYKIAPFDLGSGTWYWYEDVKGGISSDRFESKEDAIIDYIEHRFQHIESLIDCKFAELESRLETLETT